MCQVNPCATPIAKAQIYADQAVPFDQIVITPNLTPIKSHL